MGSTGNGGGQPSAATAYAGRNQCCVLLSILESKGRTTCDHQVFSIGERMRGTEAGVRRWGGGGRANASTGYGRAWAALAVPRTERCDPTDASGGNLFFCFLLRQRLRSQLLCGALGFRPATCAEARLCPPKRHILRAPPAPPSHPTALVFLKSQLSPRTPFHRRLQFGETWPPPHASERQKQILTKPCWRINLSTGGGRARAAG